MRYHHICIISPQSPWQCPNYGVAGRYLFWLPWDFRSSNELFLTRELYIYIYMYICIYVYMYICIYMFDYFGYLVHIPFFPKWRAPQMAPEVFGQETTKAKSSILEWNWLDCSGGFQKIKRQGVIPPKSSILDQDVPLKTHLWRAPTRNRWALQRWVCRLDQPWPATSWRWSVVIIFPFNWLFRDKQLSLSI